MWIVEQGQRWQFQGAREGGVLGVRALHVAPKLICTALLLLFFQPPLPSHPRPSHSAAVALASWKNLTTKYVNDKHRQSSRWSEGGVKDLSEWEQEKHHVEQEQSVKLEGAREERAEEAFLVH